MGIRRDNDVFSPNQYENIYYEAPVVAKRAPTVNDKEEIGKIWIDTTADNAYILTNVTAGNAVWIGTGGGTGTFNAVTATTGDITATLGDIVASAGNLEIAGTVTFGAMVAGVLVSSAAGAITSSTGTDGQILIDSTAGAPAWANLTAGAGIVITDAANAITITATGAIASTFPTDAGIATPAAGALTVAGGGNMATAGAGSTVTISLADDVTTVASLTASVDFTMASGTCFVTSTTNAPGSIYLLAAGGAAETIDIFSTMGTSADAINVHSVAGGVTISSAFAGADSLTLDSTDAAGGIEMNYGTGGMAVTGTNGAFVLETGTGAITIGNDAVAHDVTLGNAIGATSLVLASGTGNVVASSTGTFLIDAAGVLELNSSAGIIGIGNDAVAQNINIGTGAAARIVTVGNASAASQVVVNCGTAGVSIGASANAHTSTFGSTNTTSSTVIQSGSGDVVVTSTDAVTIDAAGVLELNSSAGIISIGNDAVAQNINVGTGAAARTVTVGNANTTTAVAINSGTGDITATSTDAIFLDAAGVLELNSSAGIISIGNDAVAQNINIGTGAAARVVTIGNITDATQVAINSGTAGIAMASTGAGDITINSDDTLLLDADGVLELNSSAGIISIGNDADALGINVGTGAAARPIIIGNATAGTTLVLTGGDDGNIAPTPATNSAASANITLNAKLGVTTHTGLTTAAAASQAFTITNDEVSAGSGVIVTVGNGGANDAQMTLTRVNAGAGSLIVTARNDGAASLNGDVVISFWILN